MLVQLGNKFIVVVFVVCADDRDFHQEVILSHSTERKTEKIV